MVEQSSAPHKGALWLAAQALNARAQAERPLQRPLPPLLFVTDPQRTPDPESVARRLPRGAGVVYRSFGAREGPQVAARLAEIAEARGLVLLVGVLTSLADHCGALGLHLPERMISRTPELRRDRPGWLITAAVHDEPAIREAEAAGVDAVLLSTVFHSLSPSAGPALGVRAFSEIVSRAEIPVYALGGVNGHNAELLAQSGAVGLAAVEGVLSMNVD